MKRRFGALAVLLAALLLGISVPILLGRGSLLSALSRFPPEVLLLMLGIIFLAWNFNAGRLRLMLGGMGIRLKQRKALAIGMSTEFAICATPGGTGGPLTYAWMLKRQSLSMTRGAALYVLDQLFDMLFFALAVLAFGIYWLIFPSDIHLGWQLCLLGAFLFLGLGLAGWLINHNRTVLLATGRLLARIGIKEHYRRRLARRVLDFHQGLSLVKGYARWRLLMIYLLCAGHWLLRYSILYITALSLHAPIDWSYAFLVQMLSLSAGQATFMPGGSGGAEATGSLLLLPYMDPGTAAATVLIWRFVTFYWYLIAGGVVFATVAGRPLWRTLQKQQPKTTR